jgi:hypothetical protein
MVNARTFRSHADSERHERVDPDDPLLRIPILQIRELRSENPNGILRDPFQIYRIVRPEAELCMLLP